MNVNRRTFFALTGMAGALTALPRSARALSLPDPDPAAVFRPSCQDGVAPGGSFTEKLDLLESLGFVGVELGGGGLANRVEQLKKDLRGRKIKVSAICAGFQGVPISEKKEERAKAVSSCKEILTAAGELGSTGLIIVPAFNGQTQLGHQESRDLLVKEILPELGAHAVKADTRILLEPLNRGECYFLRQLADAAAICRDVNSPGICQMGDFWHMTWEETNDLGAFISAGKYLHHVHIASRKTRNMPGQDEGDDYTVGMRGLKAIGYQDFISLECGCKEGQDRKEALANAVRLMRDNWDAA